MQSLTTEEIIKATGGMLIGGGETVIKGISTNSRENKEGELFIPLIGDKFDGHEFIRAAFELGASAALTSKETELFIGKTIIRVKDTKKALGAIAAYYKEKHNVPTIAVTGSVGKTTTKDMVYSVISQKYNTLKTEANFNNDIGLPLTIFRLEKEHEAAVLEMGMNHFGEIDYLASIGKPDVAIITNIGESHIENLGSREGIFKAKMEITNRFGKDNTLIVNGDNDFLRTVKGEYKVVRYGLDSGNDVYAKDIVNKGLGGISFTAVVNGTEYAAELAVPGEHNVYNALAAICAGIEFKIPMDDILRGIKTFEPTAQRLAVENYKGITIINDCYNASPDSIKAALKVLAATDAKRRVAVLGDVLEMGEHAPSAHYGLAKYVKEAGVDVLVTAGENMKNLARGAKEQGVNEIHAFDKTLEACNFVKDALKEGDAVLIKASHGMRFEEVYNAIKDN